MRIGLLLVGHVAPTSTHIAGDYPELFTAVLADPELELVRYDLDQDQFPDSTRECDGWLLSPSRCSVTDAHPWIGSAADLVRELIVTEQPYVGICFGHQLAAQALGAKVARAPDGWQVGVHDYEIVAPAPWMEPPAGSVALIASHEDQVLEIPPGAELLLRSSGCPVAGLTLGPRAWSIQPHPEFTPELADHLLAQRVDLIGAEKVAAARSTLARPLDRMLVGRWVGRFFTSAR
ncbi:MAG: type 1 glutamine amidotransferase [Acidimicrobiia bacterium]